MNRIGRAGSVCILLLLVLCPPSRAVAMQFKTVELSDQWYFSDQLQQKTKDVAESVDQYVTVWYNHKNGIVITELVRPYDSGLGMSHPEGRAFDMRIWDLSERQIGALVRWINKAFVGVTAIRHDVGLGDHIHVQVDREI